MEIEKLLSEYVAGIEINKNTTPAEIKKYMEDNSEMTAGTFLKRLKELKISGTEFADLLGNSRIGNAEFHKIESNPHLKFEELLAILDNSALTSKDYKSMLEIAAERSRIKAQQIEEELNKASKERERTEQLLARAMKDVDERLSADMILAEYGGRKSEVSDSSDADKLTESQYSQLLQDETENSSEENEAQAEDEPGVTEPAEETVSEENTQSDELNQNEAFENEDSEEAEKEEAPETSDENEQEKDVEEKSEAQTDTTGVEDDDDWDINDVPSEFTTNASSESFRDVLDEEITADVKTIGKVIRLINDDDGDDEDSFGGEEKKHAEKRTGNGKKYLITAFVLAGILVGIGGGYKLLRHFGVLPTYTYSVTNNETQNIRDYASLLSESIRLSKTVHTVMPTGVEKSENSAVRNTHLISDDITIGAEQLEGKTVVRGAKLIENKASDSFSFEVDLTDVSIYSTDGKIILVGKKENQTVSRIYSKESIVFGESISEITQTGEFIDAVCDGKYLYTVSKSVFDLEKALPERPRTFLPYYVVNGESYSTEFEEVSKSSCICTGEYIALLRSDVSGKEKSEITVINACQNSAVKLDANGLCVSKTYNVNGDYKTELTSVAFEDKLRTATNQFAGYIYPDTLELSGEKVYCVASVISGGKQENALLISNISFEGEAVKTPLSEGIYSGGVITDDRYSFVSDGKVAFAVDLESGAETTPPKSKNMIKVSDSVYVSASVEADSAGKRKGIKFSVTDENGDEKATELLKASGTTQGNWNDYITTPADENKNTLAVYKTNDGFYAGVPINYFDGVSTVSEYVFFKYSADKLTNLGKLSVYDLKNADMYCEISESGIVALWNNRIITADMENISVISDLPLAN